VAVGGSTTNRGAICTVCKLSGASSGRWWAGFKFTVGTRTSNKASIRTFLDIHGAGNRLRTSLKLTVGSSTTNRATVGTRLELHGASRINWTLNRCAGSSRGDHWAGLKFAVGTRAPNKASIWAFLDIHGACNSFFWATLKFTAKSRITEELSSIITDVAICGATTIRAGFKVTVRSTAANWGSISTVAEFPGASSKDWAGFKLTVGTRSPNKASIGACLYICSAYHSIFWASFKLTTKSWVPEDLSSIITCVGINWAASTRAGIKVAVGSTATNRGAIFADRKLPGASSWRWEGVLGVCFGKLSGRITTAVLRRTGEGGKDCFATRIGQVQALLV